MRKRRTRSGVLKVGLGAGAALALTWLIIKTSNRSSNDSLASYSNDPATDYETALARFAQVHTQEEADESLKSSLLLEIAYPWKQNGARHHPYAWHDKLSPTVC